MGELSFERMGGAGGAGDILTMFGQNFFVDPQHRFASVLPQVKATSGEDNTLQMKQLTDGSLGVFGTITGTSSTNSGGYPPQAGAQVRTEKYWAGYASQIGMWQQYCLTTGPAATYYMHGGALAVFKLKGNSLVPASD